MKTELLDEIKQANPWLEDKGLIEKSRADYLERAQSETLLLPDWDDYWLVLTGPRRAGKTTLGKHLASHLIAIQRYQNLLYLNCDYTHIRDFLHTPLALGEIFKVFNLTNPIVMIDEVQRLPNPGLLLKLIADLKWPIKMIATGSSQLEIRSKVQEHLTGRQLNALILPLSFSEVKNKQLLEDTLIYGCYPQIVLGQQKRLLLQQLYQDYVTKDIVSFLQIGQPDVLEKLVTLLAHSSGQLVNYQQLAMDCQLKVYTLKHYLSILEQTFVIVRIQPFVGNKRSEIVSNPVYYFIDNGFRNVALNNFASLESRTDNGLLVEGYVFQELYKYRHQHFQNFEIHYWRTKSGAEVDFVIQKSKENIIPIEVKFRATTGTTVSRSLRSFIDAYQPSVAVIITKNEASSTKIDNCEVHFIPLVQLEKLFAVLDTFLAD